MLMYINFSLYDSETKMIFQGLLSEITAFKSIHLPAYIAATTKFISKIS